MKKFYLKLAAIAVLIVATFVLAAIEIKHRGTITGITLIPMLIGLGWLFAKMAKEDVKDIFQTYQTADDE